MNTDTNKRVRTALIKALTKGVNHPTFKKMVSLVGRDDVGYIDDIFKFVQFNYETGLYQLPANINLTP